MIDQEELDAGTIAALMIRFKDYRLPRAKRLLERVNKGERLTEEDIRFLKRVYRDGWQVQPLVKRHPEYSDLVARTLSLYTEIITKGIENEGGPVPTHLTHWSVSPDGERLAELEAQCIWCRRISAAHYVSGFAVETVSDSARQLMDTLLLDHD